MIITTYKGLFIYYVIRVGGRGGSANCLLHITERGVGVSSIIMHDADGGGGVELCLIWLRPNINVAGDPPSPLKFVQ